MKNKIISLFLSALIVFSLYGCSGNTRSVASKETGTTQNADSPQVNIQDKELEYALKTFMLWVPGASYTVDNYDSKTSTLYTSSGTQPESTITINPNGTYSWNSVWDGKIISGLWQKNSDGSITLLNGQEGKNWTVAKSNGVNEDIFLMDGSTWYSGKAVILKTGTK